MKYRPDGNRFSFGRFSWHQGSDYVFKDHVPYLTCWIALDDATEHNGALRVISLSELGVRTRVTPTCWILVGYFGPLPGTVIEAPPGNMICFSSTLFHSSGTNDTGFPRRAYLAQYPPSVDASDRAQPSGRMPSGCSRDRPGDRGRQRGWEVGRCRDLVRRGRWWTSGGGRIGSVSATVRPTVAG